MLKRSLFAVLLLLPHITLAQDTIQSPGSPSVTSSQSSSQASSSSAAASSSVTGSSVSATSSTQSSNATSAPATTSSTGSVIPVSVTSSAFQPFPTPTQQSVPGIFPDTDPQYPPPPGSGAIPNFAPAWSRAYAKAKAKVATLSLEQKVNVTTGVGWAIGRCVGNIPPVGDWPGLCLEDSPLGVRFADFATAFPAGINAAASWNRDLIRERGLLMGREHHDKGVNIALGPMTNMGRDAQGGRNWEGFGADPYLSGEATYETVLGLQSAGVAACVKHLVGNEQEYKRTISSSNIDDRTMHEVYTHPFMRGVQAGTVSMMCSYNLINNTYACENDKVMNDIIKREYGFQGHILSDWSATHSTMSAMTGLDMTMPGDITFDSGDSYFGGNLTSYVRNGKIPEARLDDMTTRILAGWYLMRQDQPSFPAVSFDAFNPDDDSVNQRIDVQQDHYKFVRTLGAASTILLKNSNNALPFNGGCYTNRRRDVNGYLQDDSQQWGGSNNGCKKLRTLVMIGNDAGPAETGPNGFSDQGGSDGILAMGWGSGTAWFPYLVNPLDAIQRRARRDKTTVSWMLNSWDLGAASSAAKRKDAAIVFIKSDSGEQYINVDGNQGDRNNLTAWDNGDNLVLAVAQSNPNTIVVVNSVGPLIIEKWADHPNVTAILWAGLQGQEAGNSLTDILYGDWNPSGRLPYTIARRPEDYPAAVVGDNGDPNTVLEIPYTEGLHIDYRHFDAANIQPRYEFGFGLSYTKFDYSGLAVTKVPWKGDTADERKLVAAWDNGDATPIAQGSSVAPWLHRPAFQVSFNVKNTGHLFGGEIPQLYLQFPASSGEPPNVLRGFSHIELAPGQLGRVTLTLSRYDLSIWDVVKQGWRKPSDGSKNTATIGVSVGASSRDFRVKSSLNV
ncbi:glycoside hydrolase family 3 protein [Pluteus cervinus]|uniref:Glycoside hydrolase family 3 protein n=1 Tax=Pluteus cervinus TaxID=181527 RepID=A0ACD3ANN0_9AGAR|nr:glycoside hydrolase family 3 protein [Pluteus cervinus]